MSWRTIQHDSDLAGSPTRHGFTLVEMLAAMAITLVMMAAVVTVFANVSSGVQKRRAVIELNGQLRHVRNMLQRDLAGATCPVKPWTRIDSNHGYFELIEGRRTDFDPSMLTNNLPADGELDPEVSLVPRYVDGTFVQELSGGLVRSTLNGLGDSDDVLMLTVRNEEDPFVGRGPTYNGSSFNPVLGATQTVQSPLAEVVWFSFENLPEPLGIGGAFGESGMRTIYRRTLLIAPWLGDQGELARLDASIAESDLDQAIAALIAFQETYDLSVRLEWSARRGFYTIVANTLADLTKRENRFEHYGYVYETASRQRREFPFAAVTGGRYSNVGGNRLRFVSDNTFSASPGDQAEGTAQFISRPGGLFTVGYYVPDPANLDVSRRYGSSRPFIRLEQLPDGGPPATPRAVLNDEGEVVAITNGLVPLSGTRRGEDVMLSNVLGFDLRVFDPGAPIFGQRFNSTSTEIDAIARPTDPVWLALGVTADMRPEVTQGLFPAVVDKGAYVDLGYGTTWQNLAIQRGWYQGSATSLPDPLLNPSNYGFPESWFAFEPNAASQIVGADGTHVYDTWPFHYENDGLDQDVDDFIDEGTDGLDSPDRITGTLIMGVDDAGERETAPPYWRPLRGIEVQIRAFEGDSQQMRQVSVRQNFLPQ